MIDFDWRDSQDRGVAGRFPDGALGLSAWRSFVATVEEGLDRDQDQQGATARLREAFDGFLGSLPAKPRPHPCRVFISHRMAQPDEDYARRIAWIADQKGFGFWLDVLDPTLRHLNRSAIAPPVRDLLVAAAIEIGLLNSTHVLAVMTANSAGSKWIPYEYGRAKSRRLVSRQAAIWADPTNLVAPLSYGEYVSLGAILQAEREIETWLDCSRSACLGRGPTWAGTVPRALP